MCSRSDDITCLAEEVDELKYKFQQAGDWVDNLSDRLERLEVLLFRTPVADFLHIDQVIDRLAAASREEPSFKASKLYPPDDISTTKLSSTVMSAESLPSFTDESSVSLSWIDRSLTLGLTTKSECTIDASLRLTPGIHFPLPAIFLSMEKSRESCQQVCEVDTCEHQDCKDHIFPEIFPWSTQPLTLDPSWTEPVPRDLELSQRMDIASASLSYACASCEMDVCTQSTSSITHGDVVGARTPSPERHYDALDSSIDDKGRMFAHLIAENARLQTELQIHLDTRTAATKACPVGAAHDDAQDRTASSLLHEKSKARKLSKKERERRVKRSAMSDKQPGIESSVRSSQDNLAPPGC